MKENNIFNEAILKPGFPLEGTHLVAASAGTGKTYSIQNIYARLIIEKGLRVSQIQVMTYTDAATKELHDRLHNVLTDINICLDGKSCEGKNAQSRTQRANELIAACTKTNIQETKAAIGLALLEFDNAAISTIHGFCSRALARHAFETHTPFNMEIEDNKSAELEMRTLDWWRTHEKHAPQELLPALSLKTLKDYVKNLAGKADWKLDAPDTATAKRFMLQTAATIVEAYENDRPNRSKQTYDDLLRAMRDALKGPFGQEFAAMLREDFKAALIDEFQDTDPVQLDIFRLIFLANPQMPVFFVGDPKQAIYAFRGGDIFTYRAAAEKFVSQERKYELDTNHRSTKRLIDAVNAIFMDQKTDGKKSFTFGDPQIDYPEPINASEDNPPPLKINGEDDPKPFKFIQAKGNLHDVLVQEVINTLMNYRKTIRNDDGTFSEGPLSPQDIAILVAQKKIGSDIMKKLKACGVPCVHQKPGNVFAKLANSWGGSSKPTPTRMMREIYSVLKAMANPSDGRQVRTALATSFFGVPSTELLDMKEDTLADWIGVFNELNKTWLKRGFGAAISQMQKCGIRNDIGYKQRLAALPDGERLLADSGQIFELAIAAVKELGPSPGKLLNWLEDRVIKGDDEKDADAYARELESEHDAVRIITMHYSKGLQFPVVFLPECNVSPRSAKSDNISCYHVENQENGNGYQLVFSTETNQQAITEEKQEKLRLLYVAMTRAERRTVALYTGNIGVPLQTLINNARSNGAGDEEDSPIEWIDNAEPSPEPPQYTFSQSVIELAPAPSPRIYDLHSTKGSYTALSPSVKPSKPPILPQVRPPLFQIPHGSNIGSCWHEILEKIPFNADDATIRPVAETTLLNYGFNPQEEIGGCSYLDLTTDMLMKTLDFQIQSPSGEMFSLREVNENQRLSELEFDFPSLKAKDSTQALAEVIRKHWNGDDSKKDFLKVMNNWDRPIPKGFINGFIDLFFQHGDYYYIADWKSNILGGHPDTFTESRVRKEMAEDGYFFQYLLYTAVLHHYLKDVLGDKYKWGNNLGGVRYYFLRGIPFGKEASVFADRPSEELLDDIALTLGLEVK